MWVHAKREFKRGGRKKTHMYGYLATFMLKRKLAAEPGNSFIGFVDLANECALRKLPVGDHHLNIPAGEGTYIPEKDIESSSEDEFDEELCDMRDLVQDWVEGEESEFEFPSTFSRNERRMIHLLCHKNGLNFHESIGEGSDRRLVIRRVTVSSAPSSPAINQPLPIEYPVPEELPVSLPPPKRSKRERFLPYWANDFNSSLS
jgi:hypothetical protein